MAIVIPQTAQETFKGTKVFLWVFLSSHQIAVQISERKLRPIQKTKKPLGPTTLKGLRVWQFTIFRL